MPDEGESRQVKAVIDLIINKIIKKASRILSNERGIADNIPSVSEVCGELAEQIWAERSWSQIRSVIGHAVIGHS